MNSVLSEDKQRHKGNKQIDVWVSPELHQWLNQWLDKVAAGDNFADQFRSFLLWVKTLEESGAR